MDLTIKDNRHRMDGARRRRLNSDFERRRKIQISRETRPMLCIGKSSALKIDLLAFKNPLFSDVGMMGFLI